MTSVNNLPKVSEDTAPYKICTAYIIRTALTKAHQAGIDEAVETIKEWVQENKDLTTIFGSNQAHWYIEAEALDDTFKALQDNK